MAANTISNLINELRSFETDFVNSVQRCAESAVDIALERSVHTMLDNIQSKFKDTVESFYNEYEPKYYSRRGSMYNVLKTNQSHTANHKVDVEIDYDEDAMTYRDGSNGLFNLAFVQGYHGGAAGTDHNGMTVDAPSYRWPYEKYYWWGGRAFKSESPYEQFDENWLPQYWEGQTFQNLFEENFNIEFEKSLRTKLQL